MLGRDYAYKPLPDQVLVACSAIAPNPIGRDLDDLSRQLAETGQRYGFVTTFDACGQVTKVPRATDATMSHLIIVADSPFEETLTETARACLSDWDTVSVAFAYPNHSRMLTVEHRIDALKREIGPRLNFLFPDEHEPDRCWVSLRKLINNAVCDTIRVKYVPRRVHETPAMPEHIASYFRQASQVYASEKMYLREPTDGYLAARHGDGFFITATRTNKVDLDPARISYVHSYDRGTNELVYGGAYLPSSDSVEAAIVLDACSEIDVLLHTHASKLFTRNPAFRSRVVVPPMAYGEPELGDALVSGMAEVGDGFVIMAEHGDVFAGGSNHRAFFAAVRQHCSEARRGLAVA